MNTLVKTQSIPAPEADTAQPAVVLLVDDEPNILTALKRVLRPEKLRVLTATSGREALDILAAEPVDLVISDMRMPEMDGAQFLAEVVRAWPRTVRILLTGYADLESTIAAVNRGGIFQYLAKPWEDHELLLTVRNGLERKFLEDERKRLLQLTQAQNAELRDLNEGLERRVAERTRDLRAAMGRLDRAHADLKQTYVASVRVFSGIIEMRDPGLAGHSKRVAELARAIGQIMGMREDELQHLLFAALLHDIGKVGFPDELLNKPYQSLNSQERARVGKHAIIGEGMLMGLPSLQEAARLIRFHHERHDGKGYPEGLSGNAIPLGARILALANDYDALQIGSLSGRRMEPWDAWEYIHRNSGTRYHPAVVEALDQHLKGEPEKAARADAVRLGTAELRPGMVLARDLVTRRKMLLLSEGFVLEERLIGKIQKFEEVLGEEFQIHVREPGDG